MCFFPIFINCYIFLFAILDTNLNYELSHFSIISPKSVEMLRNYVFYNSPMGEFGFYLTNREFYRDGILELEYGEYDCVNPDIPYWTYTFFLM